MADPFWTVFLGDIVEGQTIYCAFELFRKQITKDATVGKIEQVIRYLLFVAATQMRAVLHDTVFGINSWATSPRYASMAEHIDGLFSSTVFSEPLSGQVSETTRTLLAETLQSTQRLFLDLGCFDVDEILGWITSYDEDSRTIMTQNQDFAEIVTFSFLMGCDGDFDKVKMVFQEWGFRKFTRQFEKARALLGIPSDELE